MSKPLIWILEEMETSTRLLEKTLFRSYDVKSFTSFQSFSDAFLNPEEARPSLLISEVVLSGWNLIDKMRSNEWQHTRIRPFLIISKITDIDVMRRCLDEGAYDYITKPYHPNEVLLKVERALNLRKEEFAKRSSNKPFIDHIARQVNYNNQVSGRLTSREIEICNILITYFRADVPRAELIRRVWNDSKVSEKSFDVHLGNLRDKLENIGLEICLSGRSIYALREKNPKTPTLLI